MNRNIFLQIIGKVNIYILVLIWMCSCCKMMSQVDISLYVMQEVFVKTVPYDEQIHLNIEGQKANIQIETWSAPEIRIELIIQSSHPKEIIARADLDKMIHTFEKHGNQIYMRNYIGEGLSFKEVASKLNATYTITMPKDCPLYLKNQYGSTQIANLESDIELVSEFSDIGLNNISGHIELDTNFGDVLAYNLLGRVKINSAWSDLNLHGIEGQLSINAHHGLIRLYSDVKKLALDIEAQFADVLLFDENPGNNQYTLHTYYGAIDTPEDVAFKYKLHKKIIEKASFYPTDVQGLISVKLSFGNIDVQRP